MGPIRAVLQHKLLALAVLSAVVALAAICLAVLPKSWHVETVILAERIPAMPALGNPNRTVPREADDPTKAAEAVLGHDSLTALIRDNDLLRSWERTRAPAMRLLDDVERRLRGPSSEKDRMAALLEQLKKRLYVKTSAYTVTIGIDWPDADAAHALVEGARRQFAEIRRSQEVATVVDAVAVLEKHTEEARQEVDAALRAVRSDERPVVGPPRPAAPPPPLAPPQPTEREVRIAALKEDLRAKRAAIANLEDAQRRRVAVSQSRLAEMLAVYSEQHPAIRELRDHVAAVSEEPADLRALRAEEESLARDYTRAGGDSPAPAQPVEPPRVAQPPPLERPPEDPAVGLRRARLRTALARHEMLLRRLENARIELDVARSALKYRYAVLRPPLRQRAPSKPVAPLVMLGAFGCGLLLASFAAWSARDRPAAAAHAPSRAEAVRPRRPAFALTAVLGVMTVGVLVATSDPLAAVIPMVLALAAWAFWTRPVRHSALVLLFLMLALEAPRDASGQWKAPWATLGYLFNTNLNLVLPVSALRFTGTDLVALAMIIAIIWRRAHGSRIDTDGSVSTARPLLWAALAALGTTLLVIGYGLSRGGDFNQALWQCHQYAMVPIMFFILQAALRGPRDFPALGRTLLAAALVKALQAFYVRQSLGLDETALPTATSHADSMLFATAFCMMLALFFEAPTRRNLRRALLVLPVLALGMIANNRRLAWVELAVALAAMYAISPPSPLKRSLTRAGMAALPICLLYVAAGWNHTGSRAFAPVATLRSIVDSKSNRSTEERDVENYNLVANFYRSPVVGMGFGHEYYQFVRADDISHIFPQWRFIPHNSVLGLLAFGGVAGFAGMWMVLSLGVFFAALTYRRARDPVRRAAALTTIGTVIIYFVQCYGDMGFVSWHSVFLLAPALTVAGKLAISERAWPAGRARSRFEPGSARISARPGHALAPGSSSA